MFRIGKTFVAMSALAPASADPARSDPAAPSICPNGYEAVGPICLGASSGDAVSAAIAAAGKSVQAGAQR